MLSPSHASVSSRGVRRSVDRGACRPAIEPRNVYSDPGADVVTVAEGNTRGARHRKCPCDPAGSETLACTYAPCTGTGRSANRPGAGAIRRRSASGRRGAEADDARDAEVRLAHSSCEAGEQTRAPDRAAESVEPRGGAKGNAEQSRTCRTQSRESVFQRLDRVRQAARQRKKEKFTALMHLVDVDLLQTVVLLAAAEGGSRGGRRHMAPVRRRSGRTARATARAHPSQRLSGTPVATPVHPQSRWPHAAAGDCGARRQDRPAGAGGSAQRGLRARLPGLLVRVPAAAQPAPSAGRVGGGHHAHQCELDRGRRHQELLRHGQPRVADQVR